MSFKNFINEHDEVLVVGYGRMNRDQLSDEIKIRLEKALELIDNGNFNGIKSVLFNGVLESMVDAEIKLRNKESELKDEI